MRNKTLLHDRIKVVLETHDIRRWSRRVNGDGSFESLRCYCGEKITRDSNDDMWGHVVEAIQNEVGKFLEELFPGNKPGRFVPINMYRVVEEIKALKKDEVVDLVERYVDVVGRFCESCGAAETVRDVELDRDCQCGGRFK
jgi:hypothetical protein